MNATNSAFASCQTGEIYIYGELNFNDYKNSPGPYLRDMKNNTVTRSRTAGSASNFTCGTIKLSVRPSRQYGLSDFNRGMMLAAAFKTSVRRHVREFNRAQKSGGVEWNISIPATPDSTTCCALGTSRMHQQGLKK